MEPTQSYYLNDYLAKARRHWWIVLLALLAGTALGAEYNRRLPREYVSTASVLVYPSGQDANVAGGRTRDVINLDTEAQLVRSTAVVQRAADLLKLADPADPADPGGPGSSGDHADPGGPGSSAGHTDPAGLAGAVSIEVPANTSVLQIKFTAGQPARAQAGARAFAESYLANREANAKAAISQQSEALQARLNEVTARLAGINEELAATSPASTAYANLDSKRETALDQINQLTSRISELATQTVTGGVIIRDARLPDRPVKPQTPVNLAAGALLGLLAGIGVGGLRERLDRRVRSASEVDARCGIPVLGEITDPGVPTDDVYPPFGAGGRAFNRLRNEIVAAMRPGEQVIVVTGASRGPAATHVAANIAAALARTGTNVVLVGAHTPDSMDTTPLARLLGVAPTPGLSDVLAGRAKLSEATQRAARNPTLRVITPGGTGSAAGLLQSHTLREIVATLRGNADYLVIEAPSTAMGADAQSLASMADAAILAVELRRTRRPEVIDAAEQLRRVGTAVLGAVLMPRMPQVAGSSTVELAVAQAQESVTPRNGHAEPIQEQTVLMSTLDADKLAKLDEASGR